MGNNHSQAAKPQQPSNPGVVENAQDVDEPQFKLLDKEQRSITFDERLHLSSTKQFKLVRSEFRPLQRAQTFDSRFQRKNNLTRVQDVLHRRYFNVKPERDLSLATVVEFKEHKKTTEAVIVVDPFSTGINLAQQLLERGYTIVCVYSDTLQVMKDLVSHVPNQLKDQFAATIFHSGGFVSKECIDKTFEAIKTLDMDIIAVLAGAETGVPMTDILSERFNVRTNGSEGTEARRNKYLMGEKIRNAGLRAVKQFSATTWAEVQTFIENDLKPEPFEVIVKPVESVGSDDVTLCRSMEEVKQAFGNIQGKINGLGLENTSTLVQEYLKGTEYVIDTVSRDGKHKVVAVWEYDKRAVNGAPFVYYGVSLRAVDNELINALCDYVLSVCDALGIKNGPGHAEVKYVKGEPCLVEIGSRCHGGEGSYICIVDQCIGYNQVTATIDSYLNPTSFDALPLKPVSLKRYGCEAMLVSYKEGRLTSYPGMDEIVKMPSFLKSLVHLKEGDTLHKTIDMFSTPGSVMLVHDDSSIVKENYDRIRELEHAGLYELETIPTPKKDRRAVVVVDPFSTGAVVAKHITDRDYDCICVYSDTLENIEHVVNLVPEGLELKFVATVAREESVESTVHLIKQAADTAGVVIEAVVPGAETGVRLADEIGNLLSMRGNLIRHSAARRDKYEMGETLRSAGLRAVKQKKATTWEMAKEFIEAELSEGPLKVVLKPLESAGTDDVTLCISLEEAEKTFNRILGKVNGLGIVNNAVLVQEYLEGTEYVVDTVSRDGEHKVVAVWEYDKRQVNGAAFVYFGVRIIPASSALIKELITYQLQVLDALGIQNGPSHGELKYCRGEPVLIEVGARCHGGEGTWLPITNRCVGYNQVDVMLDAYLSPEKFEALPSMPLELLEHGCEAMLVSYEKGVLGALPGLLEIEGFPSFMRKEIFVKPGDNISKTIDMFTTPGSVMLVHKDESVLNKNLERIRLLEKSGLYELQA